MSVELSKLPILDVTKNYEYNKKVEIYFKFFETKHKFSKNSDESGNNPEEPIFGTEICYIKKNNNIYQQSSSTFGFPIIRVNQNQCYKTCMENNTSYRINMHWHGNNYDPFNDGASNENQFGPDTKIGNLLCLNNKIKNNSALNWYHPHTMFNSSPYVYLGMVGLFEIIDKKIDKIFKINNNYLPIVVGDLDLNENGTINKQNLYNFQWLGNYSHVNGTTCVNWTDSDSIYVDNLYHETNNNLFKISILNGTCSWRQYLLGVCDKNGVIKKYFFIESDTGYRKPKETIITGFSPGERIGIMFDLNCFEDNEAYLFFYNIDFTNPNKFELINEYIKNICDNNLKKLSIKKFLKIKQTNKTCNNINKVEKYLNKLVFGDNYCKIKSLKLNENYYKYLNKNYYYNLPSFNRCSNKRKFIFFLEKQPIANLNMQQEYCNFANRIFVDMWKETIKDSKICRSLPSCLFKISKYKNGYLKYANYRMSDNHLLKITIIDDLTNNIIISKDIVFPEIDKPINIIEWTQLVNKLLEESNIDVDNYKKMSDVLEYNWEYYKYKVPYNTGKIETVNNVKICNINKSKYRIKLEARWTLLNFFGKPFIAMMPQKLGITEELPKMMGNLQELFVFAGSPDGNAILPNANNMFKIEINPLNIYCGYVDGFMNDNFFNYSVIEDISEEFTYVNLDDTVSHPFHFHMTSGYKTKLIENTKNCLSNNYSEELDYSQDTYAIKPQNIVKFNVKYINRNSYEGPIKYLGFMYHCHLMSHHDMNMMGQFFVFPKNKICN